MHLYSVCDNNVIIHIMKKLSYVFAAAAIVMATASCEKISDIIHGVSETEEGLVDDKGKDLTPDEQKVKIEETANTLMELMDKSQWEAEYNKVNSTVESMGEKNLNGDNVSEYLENIVSLWESVEGEDPNKVYVIVAHLTDLKGHFTENAEGGFDIDPNFDDLAITVFDNGVPVTATFAAKDEGPAPFHYVDENDDVTYYIPGKVLLTISKNNELLGSLELRLNPKDVNADGYITEDDAISIGYTIKVGVYTFELSQADYATDHASVKASIKNGKKLVIGAEVSASYAYTMEEKEEGNVNFEVTQASAKAMVDLAGKTQIRFSLPDAVELETLTEELYKQEENEEAYKETLAKIEKLYGFGVYYDGKKTLQATLGFEPMYDETYKCWNASPVIRFADGTSYAVEEYFTEERFGDLAQSIMTWVNDLYSYLGLDKQENAK